MSTSTTMIAGRYVYASMLMSILMMASLLWLPATLGALAQGYHLGTTDLSQLASVELIGFLLATLFTSTKTVPELKRWVFVGALLLIISNLTLLFFAPNIPFIIMRPIAGLGAGLCFGLALKVCAMSEHPTRSFGIFTGCMSVMMIIGFQSIAYLIDLQTSESGIADPENIKVVVKTIFGIFTIFSAIAILVYISNQPKVTYSNGAEPPKAHGIPKPVVLLGLLAIVVMFIGQGGVWAFLQTLGISHGFSVSSVANAMSAFAIFGIIGSFSAAALPHNIPRWVAIGIALLVLWCGLYALYSPQTTLWYIAGCAIGGFYWNFSLPLMLGLLAQIDHTGRGSVLGGSMSSAGGAIGPLIAGLLIHDSNYQPAGWMAAILCLIGLGCIWFIEKSSRTSP